MQVEPVLVGVVLLQRCVPVEVIGREIGHRADRRHQIVRVVELERRELKRNPLRALTVECHL